MEKFSHCREQYEKILQCSVWNMMLFLYEGHHIILSAEFALITQL